MLPLNVIIALVVTCVVVPSIVVPTVLFLAPSSVSNSKPVVPSNGPGVETTVATVPTTVATVPTTVATVPTTVVTVPTTVATVPTTVVTVPTTVVTVPTTVVTVPTTVVTVPTTVVTVPTTVVTNPTVAPPSTPPPVLPPPVPGGMCASYDVYIPNINDPSTYCANYSGYCFWHDGESCYRPIITYNYATCIANGYYYCNGTVATASTTTSPFTNYSGPIYARPAQRVVYVVDSGVVLDWAAFFTEALNMGYNVVMIGFYVFADVGTIFGNTGSLESFQPISPPSGLSVLMSVGGPLSALDESNYTQAEAIGTVIGELAVSLGFTGIDFNMEFLQFAGLGWNNFTLDWIVNITNSAHSAYSVQASTGLQRPRRSTSNTVTSSFIITHTVMPFFFTRATNRGNGVIVPNYLDVERIVGGLINWYNIEYYSQGNAETGVYCYSTSTGLSTNSSFDCPFYPGSSVQEITLAGVESSKIVIGKPFIQDDVSSHLDPIRQGGGYVSGGIGPLILNNSYGGIMGWKWHGNTNTDSCASLLGSPSCVIEQFFHAKT